MSVKILCLRLVPFHHPHLSLSRYRGARDLWLLCGSLQAEEGAPEPPASLHSLLATASWSPTQAISNLDRKSVVRERVF